MKKEIYIFIGIFLVLAISMHYKEWLSHPIDHITSLPTAGAFGIGAIHPLVFTFIIYIMVSVVRVIGGLLGKTKQ